MQNPGQNDDNHPDDVQQYM